MPSHKGLYLLVSASGQRRWVYRYTKPTTGKVTEAGLGGFDVLGLADARDVANDHRKGLKGKGKVDPIEAKRAAKAERLAQKKAAITFGEVATDLHNRKGIRLVREPLLQRPPAIDPTCEGAGE